MYKLAFLTLLTAFVAAACDSPTEIDANRRYEVGNIQPDEDFFVSAAALYECPGTRDIAVMVFVTHDEIKDPNNVNVRVFHERFNVRIMGEIEPWPVLVGSGNNEKIIYPFTFSTVLEIPEGTPEADLNTTELVVVVNDKYSKRIQVDLTERSSRSGEGEFQHDFGDAEVAGTRQYNLNFCQHCRGFWTLESFEFNNPDDAFHLELPATPHKLPELSDFEGHVEYRPKTTGSHSATLRLKFSSSNGTRFESVYHFSGRGV